MHVRLTVEVIRRAIDGQRVIVGIAKGSETEAHGIGIAEMVEKYLYFLGWTMPRCPEFDKRVRIAAQKADIPASRIFALCDDAEALANHPERAAVWPVTVVVDNARRAKRLM